MYRALYDYKTEMKDYLSFQAGDQFTLLDSSLKDWLHVQNGFGQIGYVPKNYVERDSASFAEILQSIDRAIEVIHYEVGSHGGEMTHSQRLNLQTLLKHRENVLSTHKLQGEVGIQSQENKKTQNVQLRQSHRTAPPPPTRTVSGTMAAEATIAENSTHNGYIQQPITRPVSGNDVPKQKQINIEQIKPRSDSNNEALLNPEIQNKPVTVDCAKDSPSSQAIKNDSQAQVVNQSGLVDLQTVRLPSSLGHDLIEEVRISTGLSYKKSGIAVETVLSNLRAGIPDVAVLISRIYDTMKELDNADCEEEETSSDYQRLCELFEALTACKDDSQQRGWALHEDEYIISGHLEEMASILENAKASVSKRAIARDNYDYVDHLVQYYQMETRLSLRLLLLRVFVAVCTLDRKSITVLLFSILTTELAEEIQRYSTDQQRINHVTMVLTMLFSTGEQVPANLHDHVGEAFLHFVFGLIETHPCPDFDDTAELLVNLILAYNLHFPVAKDNVVMKVIAEKRTVKVFTEKILLLFNRDDDPVQVFDHLPRPPNSVMKLLQDMYSTSSTANIIYTNDERVLVDIILQHMVDLSPGEKERTAQLKLMQLFLTNSNYTEYRHRYTDLHSCLQRIQGEEKDLGDDKHIVTYILSQLPIFKAS